MGNAIEIYGCPDGTTPFILLRLKGKDEEEGPDSLIVQNAARGPSKLIRVKAL